MLWGEYENLLRNPHNFINLLITHIMKILYTCLIMLLTTTMVKAQIADFELQELKIDMKQRVFKCELTLIVDDIYYPITPPNFSGDIITFLLAENQDYHIIVNNEIYINISQLSREVIDERDLDISSDVLYKFEKGILVFNY